MIDRYLARLDCELDDVPREARRELVEDVRGHIEEAWAASPERDRAAFEGILERLGTPEALARDGRERLGLGGPPGAQALSLLGWAAIVLTAVFAPVGLILAWLSSHWRTRDKAIATAIVLAGFLLMCVTTFAGYGAYGRTEVAGQTVEIIPAGPRAGERMPVSRAEIRPLATPLAAGLVFLGLWGAPLIAAAYLGAAVRRPARRPLVLVPIALAALLLAALALTTLALLTVSHSIISEREVPAGVRTIQPAP
jgi:MFS family permease